MDALITDIFQCDECNVSKNHLKDYYGGKCNSGIMLIFQNPGAIDESKYKAEKNLLKEIAKCRQGLHNYWTKGKQRGFFENLFQIFHNNHLIESEDIEGYINSREYFRDFYITDAIKCHGKTEDVDREKEKGLWSCFGILEREIELIKPGIIIAFGDRALAYFSKKYGKAPSLFDQKKLAANSAKIHGKIYKLDDFFLIPAIHPSISYHSPCDSYMQKLEDGISVYRRLIHHLPLGKDDYVSS